MDYILHKIDYRIKSDEIEGDKECVDILCVGAHPDDVEIGMSGSICKWVREKYKVAIVDLTIGNKSNNGNSEERVIEAKEAGKEMGIQFRYLLGFEDRRLLKNDATILTLAQLIRIHKPAYIFCPYEKDKHPDHKIVYQITREAVYDANLSKFLPELPRWKCSEVIQYYINDVGEYDCFEDISQYQSKKQDVLNIHRTQFEKSDESLETPLNKGFVEKIKIRDLYHGNLVGVVAAEVFKISKIGIIDLKRRGQ